MYDENKEIELLIDEAADEYVSLDELLDQLGMTYADALSEAEKYRSRFFDTLTVLGVKHGNISRICFDVAQLLKKDQSDNVLFVYTALLSENGLLFGKITDDEQKIRLWDEQHKYSEYLIGRIKSERILRERFKEIINHVPKYGSSVVDSEEQSLLYNISAEHPFLAKYMGGIYLDNLGELIRKVNSDELYPKIKPYIYFAVLSTKRKMMLTHRHHSPNLSTVFKRNEYSIAKNNGKNVYTYKAYLELYCHLRECYADESDIALSDYCFANLNNLSEWFYENCEQTTEIPMTLRRTADMFSRVIELCDYTCDYMDENPALDTAYDNVLYGGGEYTDFINAMRRDEDISEYALRLYDEAKARRFCNDKDTAVEYAKVCLLMYMENVNRDVLINASEYL